MSLQKINNKIENLQQQIKKQETALEKRVCTMIRQSGLLEIQISEPELKKELKKLADRLKSQNV